MRLFGLLVNMQSVTITNSFCYLTDKYVRVSGLVCVKLSMFESNRVTGEVHMFI